MIKKRQITEARREQLRRQLDAVRVRLPPRIRVSIDKMLCEQSITQFGTIDNALKKALE